MLFKYLRRAKGSNQRGSLMVEAIAMLGLIAMVTPMLYKKAAERTTEIEDINLANNARLISKALDSYITAYRSEIEAGNTVTVSCASAPDNSVSFNAGWNDEEVFGVQHLCEFLPTGYVGKNKTFQDIQVSIKKYTNAGGEDTIGGAFAMKPSESTGLPNIRTSRIASMIGANGGFTSETAADTTAYGVQGAWEIDVGDYFSGSWKPGPGAIVVTAFNTGIKDSKGYLYRHAMSDSDLNQMFTDLDMGGNQLHSVDRLIIGADETAGAASDSIYIASGDITVAGGGDLSVDDISAGDVTATSLGVSGTSTLATTTVGGTLTANGAANLNGNTTIGNATSDILTVNAGSTFNHNVTLGNASTDIIDVNGSARFDAPLTANSTATFNGATTFNNTMAVNGNLTVRDNLVVNGNTTLGNAATDTVNVNANFLVNNNATLGATSADQLDVNATTRFDGATTFNATPTFNARARFPGGINVDFIQGNGSAANNGHLTLSDSNGIRIQNDGNTAMRMDVSYGSGHTGVYVRRGFIDTTDKTSDVTENYVRTHRLISNNSYTNPITGGADPNGYDNYEINPGYTSVMRDIKLASRGGARLSDILPDFITKQIYVLDASYRHCPGADECGAPGGSFDDSLEWSGVVPPQSVSGGTFSDWKSIQAASGHSKGADGCAGANCEVSEWLGFIPAPVCPPNYSAIVTMSPLRWKMANAHYNASDDFKPGPTPVDFEFLPDQSTTAGGAASKPATPTALTYQTNTWLALTIESHCTSGTTFGTQGAPTGSGGKVLCSDSSVNTFWGWSGVMGFIYPARMFDTGAAADAYIWNPFPVYNTELSATATVYCLFMRKNPEDGSARWNTSIVETNYDQLRNFNYKSTAPGGSSRDPALGRTEDRTTSSEIGNSNQ